jgi:PST family polysaccharide transporter
MAWLGCGYWSLVGLQLSSPLTQLVLVWSISRWRPQWPSRCSETRSLLGFGANLSASSFLWCLSRGSDGILIGRFYGSAPLGLYSRAAALILRPVEQFMSPLEAVFVPTLSRLQSDPERYRRIVLRVYGAMAIASFPVSGLLLAVSHPLTLVVLGQKWEQAAPIFAGFTLIALYTPIAGITGWLLTSQCRGRDFLLQSMIGSAVTVVAFLVGLPFGPAGVATAYSLSSLLILLPVIYYIVGRRGPVTTRDLWSCFFTYLPLWVVVCGTTFLIQRLIAGRAPLEQLLLCSAGGFTAAGIFTWAYAPARRATVELVDVLQEWRNARKT